VAPKCSLESVLYVPSDSRVSTAQRARRDFGRDVQRFPENLVVDDFNGDGLVDLAISTRQDGSVAFLNGIGQGEFVRGTSVPVGVDPDCLAAGDFNGDQILDLAVCNGDFAGVISVLLGNGDGTFQAPRSIPVGFFPRRSGGFPGKWRWNLC
jgi:FG-GAP-like repeat